MTRTQIKILILSASGQFIEFYDFILFALFAKRANKIKS